MNNLLLGFSNARKWYLDEMVIFNEAKDAYNYSFTGNLYDMEEIIYSKTECDIDLKKARWILTDEIPVKIKHLRNIHHADYFMTSYTVDNENYFIVFMKIDGKWFFAEYIKFKDKYMDRNSVSYILDVYKDEKNIKTNNIIKLHNRGWTINEIARAMKMRNGKVKKIIAHHLSLRKSLDILNERVSCHNDKYE